MQGLFLAEYSVEFVTINPPMERYEEVLVCLRRIIRAVDLHSKRLMQSSGLSGPQLLELRAVRSAGHPTAGEVARKVHISHGTAMTILDRLESKGLAERCRSSEDKRKVVVSLTPDGRETVARAPVPMQEEFVHAFKRLAGWEQGQILASLERVAAMMDAQSIDASPVLATQPIGQQ